MIPILQILALIVFAYFALNVLYLFVFAIVGRVTKPKSFPAAPTKKKIAVLITSYKEDRVILETLAAAGNHNYPKSCFDVYLAADQLHDDTIRQLQLLPARVFPVTFEKGSKARSLHFLLNKIEKDDYEIAVVLDGDNIMLPGFLEEVNAAFHQGCQAFQGHRTAKNLDTPIAVLDAISEEINNHLFRKAQRAMGFSASVIGSGMAFNFSKLKEIYNKPGILDNPACDREVDFELMKANITVEYSHHARLLDEKVATEKVFRNQRRRWMESQLRHLALFFTTRITSYTTDHWNKLFINLMLPRLILLTILLILLGLLSGLQQWTTFTPHPPLSWWLITTGICILSMILATPASYYRSHTLKAVLYIPVIAFSYLKAALGIQRRRSDFVHTPKRYISSDSPVGKTGKDR